MVASRDRRGRGVESDSLPGRPAGDARSSRGGPSSGQLIPIGTQHCQLLPSRTDREQSSVDEACAKCGGHLRIPASSIAWRPPSSRILNTSDTRFRWDTPLRRANRTPDRPFSISKKMLLSVERFSNTIPTPSSCIGCISGSSSYSFASSLRTLRVSSTIVGSGASNPSSAASI